MLKKRVVGDADPYGFVRSHFCYQNGYVQSSKARFLLRLCNKNECDEREEVSHAHCAKFVYPNTIESFLRAFFQKSENFYFCNFSYKSKFEECNIFEKSYCNLVENVVKYEKTE